MKNRMAAVLLLLSLCGLVPHMAAYAASPASGASGRTPGPVVVAIVVDQLAAWVLRERLDALPPDGGFARLRREGKYFQEMVYAHAVTETAPGHASLFTGKVPREHGITSNDIPGPDGKKRATIADTSEAATLISLEGKPLGGIGASLEKLEDKNDLVATAFRGRYPKGQGLLAALSLKDRGTLFAAGEDADLAVWFDPKQHGTRDAAHERGAFVSSKRYAEGLPGARLSELVRSYASDGKDARDGVERLEDQPWKALDPAWVSQYADVPGESDYSGFVAAHVAGLAPKPGAAFRALPASDRLLLEMAVRILETEARARPTFLSISLSANDYIGHMFSPDSWEAWDELRRLDASLAWFFTALDRVAPGGWSVVLSADHGSTPAEDDAKRPKCSHGGAHDDDVKAALESSQPCSGSRARGDRVYVEDIKQAAASAAALVSLPAPDGSKLEDPIASVVFPYIYLTGEARKAVREDANARARLARALETQIKKKHKSVHAILDVVPFQQASQCPDARRDLLSALVCNAISPRPDRAGDFYIVLEPGAFFDPDLIKGMGISHGSPYGYDRTVPLFVREAHRPDQAGQEERTRVPFNRFHDELVRIISEGK